LKQLDEDLYQSSLIKGTNEEENVLKKMLK